MTSRTEQALVALHAALAAGFAGDSLPVPTRNRDVTSALADVTGGGRAFVNLVDGGSAAPPERLSAGPDALYDLQHRALVEVIVEHPDDHGRDALFDRILVAIDDALAADRELGGAVSTADVGQIDRTGLVTDGAPGCKAAVVEIDLLLTSERPF